MKILIKNAKVITPLVVLKNYSVSIENKKIKDIKKSGSFNENNFDKIINVGNKYLSPGFIDIHNHGNSGYDTMNSTFKAIDSIAKFHLKNGVTGFLPTTMTASYKKIKEAIKNVADFIEDKQNKNSQVLGLYVEGPYFSQIKKGAQPTKYIKNPDIEEVEKLIKISNGNIKVVALAPELPGSLETISYLKKRGITVSTGHTNATYSQTKVGIERGITQATHLYNGMREFSHREPGVLGAILTDERVACEIICDRIHLHDAAIKIAVKMKNINDIILISDAMMATGLKDGEYTLGSQKVIVKNGEARLSSGNLAGSTLTLNKAVYNMVHFVDIPLKDAVRMATLNPARSLGVNKRKGSIEIGKDADLIIFDDNIDISIAMVNGKILYSKKK
ncbi:MAG: N-acetylglucosamine-6-phosphate deacetylase [Firmicutes bacterium]|nr:N-acetylglucosamine-6-phosphate deacetylase [Bacillota bacterium]